MERPGKQRQCTSLTHHQTFLSITVTWKRFTADDVCYFYYFDDTIEFEQHLLIPIIALSFEDFDLGWSKIWL
jgi:hypothetical protein